MPRGPKGERRPADVIGAAVMVGRIATGQIEDTVPPDGPQNAKANAGRLGGAKGGPARAKKLSPRQRSMAAKKAAKARWGH
jgi:hypothetical protein